MLKAFTQFHVAISLIGIASGAAVIAGMLVGNPLDAWTAIFLATTLATSLTGFVFPFQKLLPSHIVGLISTVVLAIAIYARYSAELNGGWRLTYVITAVLAQYFNVFVLVVQSFLKIPSLNKLAPTQKEPPFAIAQGVVLVAFVAVGIAASMTFRV